MAEAKKAAAPAKTGGPYIYVGATDERKQLKHKTAYLQIPAGADTKQFVPLSEYPGWAKTKGV